MVDYFLLINHNISVNWNYCKRTQPVMAHYPSGKYFYPLHYRKQSFHASRCDWKSHQNVEEKSHGAKIRPITIFTSVSKLVDDILAHHNLYSAFTVVNDILSSKYGANFSSSSTLFSAASPGQSGWKLGKISSFVTNRSVKFCITASTQGKKLVTEVLFTFSYLMIRPIFLSWCNSWSPKFRIEEVCRIHLPL